MGGKSSRTRQYLFLCLTFLASLWACNVPKEVPEAPVREEPETRVILETRVIPETRVLPEPREQREARESLQLAQNLLAKGDYDGSFKENQKILSMIKDQSPADSAVFNMGLIYAHPKNPRKDNRRAISFFNRVIKSYPESPLAEQARIWVGVLDGIEKSKQIDLEIEEKKRDRGR